MKKVSTRGKYQRQVLFVASIVSLPLNINIMSSGRLVNLLDSASAESNDKPSSWPRYAMGAKARPESDRKGHCFPESAEESFTKVLPIGWKKEDRRRAVKEEIMMEQNVAVAMRDGVKLLVDVFRSPKSSKGGDEQFPRL